MLDRIDLSTGGHQASDFRLIAGRKRGEACQFALPFGFAVSQPITAVVNGPPAKEKAGKRRESYDQPGVQSGKRVHSPSRKLTIQDPENNH
ncbi:MAG TPA: hypothetical protein VK862_16515 [Afifellaceae bacterium]|nr:hypothetical protein [Afifellaceae bacterium]